ncbi:PREDICTED: uncharacterized protein LOC104824311 isoform X2 [Tarenaya hassleriana]|uniref:uncharacterized protein LOC104824311 isoform X2 n=1 Tax=Tarenaya hassleriana TaxID=28532 RepID=UPI00053C19B6|nr:PREDICTED: uncharacterized protein LOC104824311 isoform X2 [Tarenaya hassleriana]
MAPRGRPRKIGLTRADAARDAMKAYGFDMRLINETIKELLQVYGEEGWVLIEEASYKVLLDAIIEKIEEQARAEKQDHEQEEHTEGSGHQMENNSSPHVDVEPEKSPNQGTEIGTEADQAEADASSFTNEVILDSLARHSEGGEVLTTVAVEIVESSKAKETENVNVCIGTNVGTEEEGLRFIAHAEKSSHPHNGWISSDEEEGDDEEEEEEEAYVVLTPEPLSEELQRILEEANGQRKRKRKSTRWDVTPEQLNPL